jgi:hypothetical protein
MFLSLVVLRTVRIESGVELQILPTNQTDILRNGVLLNFATWWKTAPVMVGNGVQISRSDIVDMLANQDGGAHVDLEKERFVRLLDSIPQVTPFLEEEGTGIMVGSMSQPNDELACEILRAAMRTIAEEVWLSWNNQLDLIDPGWQKRPHSGDRIGPNDLISGLPR